ncbi:MAG: hypothetical protein IT464_09825 [Planctomycetes bacterium]|nr:hypothetical protein [Planctomycetota bacterium]
MIPIEYILAAGGVLAALAVVRGFWLDSRKAITQPQLFWSFLFFSLGGSLLGWRLAMRNDPDVLRNVIGLVGSLVAWRFSYFPFMVVAGWKASLFEWGTHRVIRRSIIYPVFLFFIMAQHAGVGFIGAAAIAIAQTPVPDWGLPAWIQQLIHQPPRELLWALGAVALPVAGLVSFSTKRDLRVFNDAPARDLPKVPIGEPKINPYAKIMREHKLSLPSWVLAVNARVTYPLVPHSPWGRAMKGTLEETALANPRATTRDRVDEHYQSWIASHARIHEPDAGARA